jgi:hypothetical protein
MNIPSINKILKKLIMGLPVLNMKKINIFFVVNNEYEFMNYEIHLVKLKFFTFYETQFKFNLFKKLMWSWLIFTRSIMANINIKYTLITLQVFFWNYSKFIAGLKRIIQYTVYYSIKHIFIFFLSNSKIG